MAHMLGEGGVATEPAAEMAALRARHTEIEGRLAELARHLSLTLEEQHELSRLKKEKLAGKDRLALLVARASRTGGAAREHG